MSTSSKSSSEQNGLPTRRNNFASPMARPMSSTSSTRRARTETITSTNYVLRDPRKEQFGLPTKRKNLIDEVHGLIVRPMSSMSVRSAMKRAINTTEEPCGLATNRSFKNIFISRREPNEEEVKDAICKILDKNYLLGNEHKIKTERDQSLYRMMDSAIDVNSKKAPKQFLILIQFKHPEWILPVKRVKIYLKEQLRQRNSNESYFNDQTLIAGGDYQANNIHQAERSQYRANAERYKISHDDKKKAKSVEAAQGTSEEAAEETEEEAAEETEDSYTDTSSVTIDRSISARQKMRDIENQWSTNFTASMRPSAKEGARARRRELEGLYLRVIECKDSESVCSNL